MNIKEFDFYIKEISKFDNYYELYKSDILYPIEREFVRIPQRFNKKEYDEKTLNLIYILLEKQKKAELNKIDNCILDKLLNKEIDYEQIISEKEKCKNDQRYFIRNYIYVANKFDTSIIEKLPERVKKYIYNDLVKFIPYNIQQYFMEKIMDEDNQYIAAVKSRQVGFSNSSSLLVLYQLLFSNNKRFIIFSKAQEEAKKTLREYIKFPYENLPFFLRRQKIKDNEGEFGLGNELNASYVYAKTSSRKSGRSISATQLILDEAEFIDGIEELQSAAAPTLSATRGKAIVLSTPQTYNSQFYNLVKSIEEEKNKNQILIKGYQKFFEDRDEEQYEKQKQLLNYDYNKIKTELEMDQIIPGSTYFDQSVLDRLKIENEIDDDLKKIFYLFINKIFSQNINLYDLSYIKKEILKEYKKNFREKIIDNKNDLFINFSLNDYLNFQNLILKNLKKYENSKLFLIFFKDIFEDIYNDIYNLNEKKLNLSFKEKIYYNINNEYILKQLDYIKENIINQYISLIDYENERERDEDNNEIYDKIYNDLISSFENLLDYIKNFLLIKNQVNYIKFYELPEKNDIYLISFDPYEGGGDKNAITIISLMKNKIVGLGHTKIDDITNDLIILSKYYNNAKIVIERNKGFKYIRDIINLKLEKLLLPNISISKNGDIKYEDKYGFFTDQFSKRKILSILSEYINKNIYIPEDLYKEMKFFVIKKNGNIEGLEGDDLIMASSIGLQYVYLFHEYILSNNNEIKKNEKDKNFINFYKKYIFTSNKIENEINKNKHLKEIFNNKKIDISQNKNKIESKILSFYNQNNQEIIIDESLEDLIDKDIKKKKFLFNKNSYSFLKKIL